MSDTEDISKGEPPKALDLTSFDVYSMLSLFASLLAEKAWQTMGLRTKPGTDTIETDFEQARAAIDTVSFLAEKLQNHLTEEEKPRLGAVVADLKLNYVRIAKT